MTEAAGIVVALQANYLEVELDQAPEQVPSRLLCTRRTRLTHRGEAVHVGDRVQVCLLYTSPSPRDGLLSRMPSSA